MNEIKLTGTYYVKVYEEGKLVRNLVFNNDVVNAGLDYILDQMFISLAAASGWYIGLIDDASFTSLSSSDTMASHGGWTELAAYDETTRPAWVPASIGGQTILNGTQAEFTMNATKTVKGIFIANNNTISGATGTLWSTAIISPTIDVVAASVVRVNYQLTAARG